FVLAVVVMGILGTAHERYLFPAMAVPGVASVLMLSDVHFWRHLRTRPYLPRILGFVAILLTLIVCKDLSRYPKELVGALLTDGTLELPEDFAFGTSLKL